MTKKEGIDIFSSKIIHGQMKTVLQRNNMHVITQVLKGGDGPHLPIGLNVVNTYTGDFWEQMSCGSSEKHDGHSNNYCQGN